MEALDNLAKCAARVAVKLAAICRVDLYTFGTFPRMYAKRVALPVGEQPETLLPNSSQVTEVEVREHVSVRVNMHFLFHPHYIVAHARHAEVAMRGRVALVAVVLARLGALVHGGVPFKNMFETLSKEIILSVNPRYFTTRRGGSGGGRRYTGGSARPINPLALEALRSEKFPHSVDGGSSGERSVRPPTGGAAGSSATPSSSTAVPVAPPPPPDDWYGEDLLDFLMIHEKMEEDLEEGRVEEEVEEEEEEEEVEEEEEDGGPPPQLAEMSQEDDVEEEEEEVVPPPQLPPPTSAPSSSKRKRAEEEPPPAEAASRKKKRSNDMNEKKRYSLIRLLRPRVDELRADKSKVQPNGRLKNGTLENLFESLKGQIGSDFNDPDSFRAFVGKFVPSAHVTFMGVPRDDVISMAKKHAHFDSGGQLTPPSRAKILKHVQEEHEDFSEEGGKDLLNKFLSCFCFSEMYEMKKFQREDEGIFYVATDQGEDFSVHEPSAKAALKKEEDDRDNSELRARCYRVESRRGKKRTKLVGGARERIQKASKAHGRCDGFPDEGAVRTWIKMQKKKKTADNAGGAGASGAGASASGAGAGGSN